MDLRDRGTGKILDGIGFRPCGFAAFSPGCY
jgi:hypothetical protein